MFVEVNVITDVAVIPNLVKTGEPASTDMPKRDTQVSVQM
jgi:hypothetical protein